MQQIVRTQNHDYYHKESSYHIIYIRKAGLLVGWLFIVLRPAQEYFTYKETSPLPVKGCKILAIAQRSGPLGREG
jgi:hypothetical protein